MQSLCRIVASSGHFFKAMDTSCIFNFQKNISPEVRALFFKGQEQGRPHHAAEAAEAEVQQARGGEPEQP